MPERTTARLAKRFLVAGGAGFIGSHLISRLLSEGHEVVAVDNFITGDWRNLAPFMESERFTFIAHDVVRPLRAMPPLDWILHFASPASPIKYQKYPVQTMRCNGEGTFNLLNLAHEQGAGFLLASTSEVYGDPSEHPQREQYWGHVNPVGPRAVYDEGKRYAEALATTYHDHFGVAVRIIRIFNTYGPRMQQDDGRVVVNLIQQALRGRPLTVYGDGSQTRSFQFVDDLVEGVLRTFEVDYSRPINLGNPEEFTVAQLAELILEITESRSDIQFMPLPEDDPRQRCPDILLAERLLGWRPRIALRSGLSSTIEHVRRMLESGETEARPLPFPQHPAATRVLDPAASPNGATNGRANGKSARRANGSRRHPLVVARAGAGKDRA